jgi:hypothetical protein
MIDRPEHAAEAPAGAGASNRSDAPLDGCRPLIPRKAGDLRRSFNDSLERT